ncbi:hypothetical protein QV08_10455 [Gallibacterium salpingitidis]|uniref:Wadjet protein JetD C-terminal domain-containing protein n=1 Tax=Gallibacterium salpingitidis TaxID=505341 RepID=A0AB36DZU2_9PAST|nr:Wadjet anti-phage system protein JetD domain-containing protein [Gallibacterium salpingitidis]OBX06397.1 hypothetical protein QV08_10455 [Gallibacterium salpingitidis]OBX07197.1 hypothetical protein QV09_11415 [Gallibacterium salpingitidis]WKS98925.1 DUF2220 family protein [Gallibacterium salpingitidis]
MMWTTAKEIKQQLENLWNKGFFLRSLVNQQPIFPLKLKLIKPSSDDITRQFYAVRKWVLALHELDYISIDWKVINHRVQGEQRVPDAIYVREIEQVLILLHKHKDYQKFKSVVELTKTMEPVLLEWLEKQPLKALELAEQWQDLLKVIAWKKANLNKKIYLRQIDIPKIHSKFIEKHRAILAELFDRVLPISAINNEVSGISQFALRYGFLDKPKMIRFRNLDTAKPVFPNIALSDVTLDSESFANLNPEISKVIIVENEINFLTLPILKNCWAIFGAGYGWQSLSKAKWLNNCDIYYWGDIDTHGLAILHQLRCYFPQVQSIFMDKTTLLTHNDSWSKEDKPFIGQLDRLTPQEQELYIALQQNEFGDKIRLEQEFIPFSFVERTLKSLVSIV